MKQVRAKLTYANVMVTALAFIVLAGGSAYAASHLGKNVVKSKNLAPHAVKNKDLAKNAVKGSNIAKGAVTATKVKSASLTRAQLATGTIAGTQVGEFGATNITGFNSFTPTSVPLTGTTTFTPAAGKTYEALTEIKGNPTDPDGAGSEFCYAYFSFLVDGEAVASLDLHASDSYSPPFQTQSSDAEAFPLGVMDTGQPVTISAYSEGYEECSPAMTASVRGVIIELG